MLHRNFICLGLDQGPKKAEKGRKAHGPREKPNTVRNRAFAKHHRPGRYDVLRSLPDPEPTLRGRPEYSIRLANTETWETGSGYSNLKAQVRVVS
jgi:hypothetical protein